MARLMPAVSRKCELDLTEIIGVRNALFKPIKKLSGGMSGASVGGFLCVHLDGCPVALLGRSASAIVSRGGEAIFHLSGCPTQKGYDEVLVIRPD